MTNHLKRQLGSVLCALFVCCSGDPTTISADLLADGEVSDTGGDDLGTIPVTTDFGRDASTDRASNDTTDSPDTGSAADLSEREGEPRDEDAANDIAGEMCEALESRNGFPGDFPELVDSGGFGEGETLTGFGGYTSGDRDCNRARVVRRPVVLLHGNGATASHAAFGVRAIADRLYEEGYDEAEVWAVSYLGVSVSSAETMYPTRNNVDDIRRFIDAVMDYLDVDRIDLVGHSLGAVLINGYLRGLESSGDFDNDNHRMDAVGTVVMLGSANYGTGTGPLYTEEFDIFSGWLVESREFRGVDDDTPYGATDETDMVAPSLQTLPGLKSFKATSELDTGRRRIVYVSIWSRNDVVDLSYNNTSGLQGADLNEELTLPMTAPGVLTPTMARHANLLLRAEPFEAFFPYLDQ